jgi:hypothetical protein
MGNFISFGSIINSIGYMNKLTSPPPTTSTRLFFTCQASINDPPPSMSAYSRAMPVKDGYVVTGAK